MGKAALLIVAAFSATAATVLYTAQESDSKSGRHQAETQADIIAREIARSAYNAAVADLNRETGTVDEAIVIIGDLHVSTPADRCRNGVAECYRRTGAMQGGTYLVEASRSGGIGAEVIAIGRYAYTGIDTDPASATYGQNVRRLREHAVNEFQSSFGAPLQVDPSGRGGTLTIQFVDSRAGYCSAIFLQRTLPGVAPELQPLPEMVYAPGHNRNGDRNVGYETRLSPGTQMNFGIGVDMNCGGSGTRPTHHPALRKVPAQNVLNQENGPALLATEMASYQFRTNDWDHVHWALDRAAIMNGDVIEAPWGMVEQDANSPQRWRIAFEDIPSWNLAPGHANYDRPRLSLSAVKRFGYDLNNDGRGDGWRDIKRTVVTMQTSNGLPTGRYSVSEVSGPDGFHDLEDSGSWPDFSDQVIFVEITPDALVSRR